MSKEKVGQSKPLLKPTLKFFNTKITELNTTRLHFNRNKNLAKFFAKPKKSLLDTPPVETTLGAMSFSLYFLRFTTNMSLLIQLILNDSLKNKEEKKRRDLYYQLLNDSLWSTVNLIQFFWLSYKKSSAAGLRGMQLEALVQFIDLLIALIRYQQDKEDYELRYKQATKSERVKLDIEWQHKQLTMVRTFVTSLTTLVIFSLVAFSVTSIPLSPIMAAISLTSAILRILNDIYRDQQLIKHLKETESNPQVIADKKREMIVARLNDLNQVILYNAFMPLGLFLFISTPIPVTLIASLSMLLLYYVTSKLIAMHSPDSSPTNPTQAPEKLISLSKGSMP